MQENYRPVQHPCVVNTIYEGTNHRRDVLMRPEHKLLCAIPTTSLLLSRVYHSLWSVVIIIIISYSATLKLVIQMNGCQR